MKDILVDTNIISVICCGERTQNPKYPMVSKHFRELGRRRLHIAIMSVMEIEFGLAIGGGPDISEAIREEHNRYRNFLNRYPKVNINSDCSKFYVALRAKVFEVHANRNSRGTGYVEKKTHEIKDRITDLELGIDERDLFIVSTAVASNFELITLDTQKEMKAILNAARLLEQEGKAPKLNVACWDLP